MTLKLKKNRSKLILKKVIMKNVENFVYGICHVTEVPTSI